MRDPTSLACCREGTAVASDDAILRLSAFSAFLRRLPGRAERKSFSGSLEGLEEEEEEGEGLPSAAGSASALRVMLCKFKEPQLQAQEGDPWGLQMHVAAF